MPESSQEQFLVEKVSYGTTEIAFHLQRTHRKTLAIEVHPDLTVWAIAPENASLSDIQEKLIKRGAWIVKQQRYFEQFLPRTPERQYVPGETHFYLGRRYVLRVREDKTASVKLKNGELIVSLKNKNSQESIKQHLTKWYYDHAMKKFEAILQEKFNLFQAHSVAYPEMIIRRMNKRWGSCHSNGTIILNPELIKAPTRCIEYVIVHELCHLIHPNHNQKFYDLQATKMPDWKKWKDKLEVMLV